MKQVIVLGFMILCWPALVLGITCTDSQIAKGCFNEERLFGHGYEKWFCVCPSKINNVYFTVTGIAGITSKNPTRSATIDMWLRAYDYCSDTEPKKKSKTHVIDVGTFIAARAIYQCDVE